MPRPTKRARQSRAAAQQSISARNQSHKEEAIVTASATAQVMDLTQTVETETPGENGGTTGTSRYDDWLAETSTIRQDTMLAEASNLSIIGSRGPGTSRTSVYLKKQKKMLDLKAAEGVPHLSKFGFTPMSSGNSKSSSSNSED